MAKAEFLSLNSSGGFEMCVYYCKHSRKLARRRHVLIGITDTYVGGI